MAASVYSRALQKAVELVGGKVSLCRRLRVPVSELEKWISDKAIPPSGIFLKVVDLLIEETPPPPGSEPPDPPAPHDASSSGESTTRY